MRETLGELELTLCVVGFLGMVVAPRRDLRALGPRIVGVCAVVVAVAATRAFVTRYTMLHANLLATGILDGLYAEPLQSLRTYGVFHSAVYGGLMHAFGPDFLVVARANEVFGAMTLALMAYLGSKYAGSKAAGLYVLALGLLHPAILRVTGSEEGHNLAVLLSFIALASLEAHRDSKRDDELYVFGAAIMLMIGTKQILLASIPPVLAIGLADRTRAERGRILLASLGVLPMLALRYVEWADFYMFPPLATRLEPSAVAIAFRAHPLLDLRGPTLLVAPLVLAGMVALFRASQRGRAVVAAFVFLFASSFLCFEGSGVSLTFRLPVVTFAVVLGGVGAHALVRALASRLPERIAPTAVHGVACAALVGLVVLSPGFDIVRRASAQTYEYELIREQAPHLPNEFVLLRREPSAQVIAYTFPTHLLRAAGRRVTVETLPPSGVVEPGPKPIVMLFGLECVSYGLAEVSRRGLDPRSWAHPTYGTGYTDFPVLRDVEVREDARPDCRRFVDRARPLGPERAITSPRQSESPFLYFASDTTRARFYVVDARAPE